MKGRTYPINRFVSGHGFQPCRLVAKEIRALALVVDVLQGLKPRSFYRAVGTIESRALTQSKTTPSWCAAFGTTQKPVLSLPKGRALIQSKQFTK
jgi:hypothetical protein